MATPSPILSPPANHYRTFLCVRQPRVLTAFLQILTLILLSVFTIFVTLSLMYILNPDKDPLPWRAYCSATTPFPPSDLDALPPAGVLVGVFSVDSGYERRSLVRTTWANHLRSRNGAGDGDGGMGTSRTIVRFVMGEPRKDWERRIQLEMESM
jgi:hypothetical protein